METKFNPRLVVLLLLMVVAASTRFFSISGHHPLINFTPIGTMALFGGAYFVQKWKAYFVPVVTLLVSDLLINILFYNSRFGVMYNGWYWVYGSFVLMVFIGKALLQKVTVKSVLLAGITASLAHWIISDFGVWLGGGLDITTGLPYTRDLYGLLKCYYLALPYLKDFFLGTVFFSAVMFGIFELAKRRFPALAVK